MSNSKTKYKQLKESLEWDIIVLADDDIERYLDEKWIEKLVVPRLHTEKEIAKLMKDEDIIQMCDHPQKLISEIKEDLRDSYRREKEHEEELKKLRAEHGLKGHRTRAPAKKHSPAVKVNVRKMF